MPITPLPSPPSSSDPDNFNTKADAWVAALDAWTTEVNALGASIPKEIVRTSTSSNTIDLTGVKTFGFSSANMGWAVGTRLRSVDVANPGTNYIEGIVTTIGASPQTSVTITPDIAVGTGTISNWNIFIAADSSAISGAIATPIDSASLITLRANIVATPSLAPALGTPYVLTDGALIGQVVRWDGDKFAYNGAFGKYGVVTTITSDNATDTTVKIAETIDLPVFAIGKNTKVTVNPIWTFSSTAVSNGNVISCFYGTTGGEVNAGAPSTATNATMDVLHRIQMNNSLTAQTIVNSGGIGGSGALLTGAQDFKTLMKVRLRCNWSANQATTQTIVLQGYTVRLEG